MTYTTKKSIVKRLHIIANKKVEKQGETRCDPWNTAQCMCKPDKDKNKKKLFVLKSYVPLGRV